MRVEVVYYDRRQAGAVVEYAIADGGDAFRDGDGGESAAAGERAISDPGDIFGNGVGASLSGRVEDERCASVVEQHPIETAICGVEGVHLDRRQAEAVAERAVVDRGGAAANGNRGETGAAIEHSATDLGDTVWYGDGGEASAVLERGGADLDDTAGIETEVMLTQSENASLSTSVTPSGMEYAPAFPYGKRMQRCTIVVEEHSVETAICGVEGIHLDRCQAGEVVERVETDSGDAAANRYRGEAGAALEHPPADLGDTVRYGDRGQPGAAGEHAITEERHAVPYGNQLRPVQPENASSSMKVTLSGRVMSVSPVQPANASS